MDQTLSTAVPSNSDITHEVEAEEKSIIEQPKEEMARVMDHEPVADTHTVEESESMEADGEQSQLPPTSPKDTSSSSSSSHRFIPTAVSHIAWFLYSLFFWVLSFTSIVYLRVYTYLFIYFSST